MAPTTPIVKLETPIKPYDWGSRTAIAEIQGRPSPTQEPEAELWIGDHPKGTSRVIDPEGTTPLNEWCAARGADALGAGRDALPYLVKILAAAQPLSVQLHPNTRQAAKGFAREEAAGLALGDPSRSYSDPNAKTEAICALGRFEALCGLRPGAQVREFVTESGSEVARDLLTRAAEGHSEEELAGVLFCSVLTLHEDDPARAARLAEEITHYGERCAQDSVEAKWIGRLAKAFPADRMLMAPILLNYVELEAGQALEVPPNTLHSYLVGTGVEVMTSSDNVVRGGLTHKHVARDELASLLDGRASEPRVCQAPPAERRGLSHYPLALSDFQISRVTVAPGDNGGAIATGAGQPRILLCLKNPAGGGAPLEIRDASGTGSVFLSPGEAAFIPACVKSFELSGSAESFLVEPGAES